MKQTHHEVATTHAVHNADQNLKKGPIQLSFVSYLRFYRMQGVAQCCAPLSARLVDNLNESDQFPTNSKPSARLLR
jgi:hypothetical protein